MDRGNRVPTFLISHLWSEKIGRLKEKSNLKGLIIDGSPRSLLEAELMNNIFNWYEWTNVKVISLEISDQEAFDRLTKRRICEKCGRLIPWVGDFRGLKVCDKCGGRLITRPDDKPESIRARLDYYQKDVQPAIDYYQKQGRLIEINGDQPIEDVYRDIKKAI